MSDKPGTGESNRSNNKDKGTDKNQNNPETGGAGAIEANDEILRKLTKDVSKKANKSTKSPDKKAPKITEKLTEVTPKKTEGEKEKKWKIGFGSTEIRDPENPLNSMSATGAKLTNKSGNIEVTAGLFNNQEQRIPGQVPKNETGFGVGGKITF